MSLCAMAMMNHPAKAVSSLCPQGAAFETWLVGQPFNADQIRLLRLVKEQIKAEAADLDLFQSWRFDAPPLSMNGGYERACAVFCQCLAAPRLESAWRL